MKRHAMGPRMNSIAVVGFVTLLTLSMARSGAGQQEASERSPMGAVIGGTAGGALGFFLGAHVGDRVGDCQEICGEVVIGAVGGQALGVPLGAHVGNSRRGDLAASLGVSLLSAGLGVAGWAASNDSFYLFATIAQVALVAVTEIKTSPDVSVSAGPRLIGDEVGLGIAIRW